MYYAKDKILMKRTLIITTLLAILSFLLLGVDASAQSKRSVTAILQDSSNGEAVPFATVSLTKKGATKPAKYVLSDADGKATIEKVSAGAYTLKAELLGYKPYTQEINVTDALDLGVLKMDPDTKMLEAASVTAAGNPIVVKKDTIEYNASSFKTTDNDMLEDLLKKLPGVEVGEDGSVTANGQTISKITIDGKTFFLDDPQLASKNIPAKIIEKVKVVEKKSEQAEFTGIDDGNEETVIDLSIQKGMMNGTFGNLMVGGGHDIPSSEYKDEYGNGDYRFQGAGFLGRFTEENQLSVILNGNNTNNRGFNDLAGSMMQGMRGGGGMGRGSGGWGSGNGITTSWLAGVNGSSNFFDDKMEAEGNYLFNGSDKYITETSDKRTYLDDYDLLYHTDGYSQTKTYGHRIGARIEHKFSENTSILFQPQFNIGHGSFVEDSQFSTEKDYDGTTYKTNDGFNVNTGDSKNQQANGFFLFRQRLGIPGRTLSFNTRYSFSNVDMDGYNKSLTNNYAEDGDEITSYDLVNQRYSQNQKSKSLSGRLTYTEPLGKGFYLEGNYELSWSENTSKKDTYDSFDNPNFSTDREYISEGEAFNDSYSNSVLNRAVSQRIGANFMYQNDKLHAQIGLAANPTKTHNETTGYDAYDNKVLNWAPQLMCFYDFSDNSNFRFFYNGRSSQPSTTQLMPVADNSNPLSVSFGNLELEPYFTHSVRSDLRFTNKETFMTIHFGMDGNLVQNPVVNATWYGLNGAQFSMPVNGKNSARGNFRLFINSPIAKSDFSIFSMTSMGLSRASSYVGSSFDMSDYYDSETGTFNYELFNVAYPDLDESDVFTLNTIKTTSFTERLRFTYRTDALEVTLGGRTRMNHSTYTISTATNTRTWNNQISSSIDWTLPAGFGITADARYNWYRGYTTSQDPEFLLNASITKLLFDDRMTLALNAYDIFNQAKNLSVTDASNYHMEAVNNTLGRYIILSVTWRFGNFGDAMKNARGGPGRGPGGGPRGPMGPPPR